MINRFFYVLLFSGVILACTSSPAGKGKERNSKVELVQRERCSFDLPGNLFLDKINASFSEEGYFKIGSSLSNNLLQLFVFDAPIDVDDKVDKQVHALNSPEVFTASTVDSIRQLGKYEGKGVIMTGIYNGGVIKGSIKIFCYGKEGKGFLVVRQTLSGDKNKDKEDFDLVEKSFLLK